MMFLKHHPNKAHKVQDVYEAAHYILQDEGELQQSSYPVSNTPAASAMPFVPTASNMPVKAEMFASVMANFSKTIADALHQSSRAHITGPSGQSLPQRFTNCNFCVGDHYICECLVVEEYTITGKVRQNIDGKVVLSTGVFVPWEIPGTLLSEWVNKWHCRNPNQLSMVALIHTILAEHIWSHTPAPTVPLFQLSTVDRITALEAELFNLHARKSVFMPVART